MVAAPVGACEGSDKDKELKHLHQEHTQQIMIRTMYDENLNFKWQANRKSPSYQNSEVKVNDKMDKKSILNV